MNEEVKNKINNMLPPELEEAKTLIEMLIGIKPFERKTNLEYLERNKEIVCPVNYNHHIKKNGHKNETQRIWCYDCKKSYTITYNTILSHSTFNYEQFKKMLQCMYDLKSLEETALEINVSVTAVFEIEIRIFEALDQLNSNVQLSGIIQADEKYVRTNFKGTPKAKMPRPSRHNGSTDLTSGISKDQVCIVAAIDSNDNLIIKVVGNGNASTGMISKALNGKITSNSILVTDSKNSYERFAKSNNLKLIQIQNGLHKNNDYNINDINEIISEISMYLKFKKGISSRHLQHHMNFLMYKKKIKYTIEYLERNEKMYVDTLSLDIKLKSDEVYSTEIPFDLEEYNQWYKNHYN